MVILMRRAARAPSQLESAWLIVGRGRPGPGSVRLPTVRRDRRRTVTEGPPGISWCEPASQSILRTVTVGR
jgi:hypothetical protein